MPPRFLERMQRQSDVLRNVFGDPENDPPPYPSTHARSSAASTSSASSFQYRRSADLSSYQTHRSSQDYSSASSCHRRQASSQSSSSLRYGDAASLRTSSYSVEASLNLPPDYETATTPIRGGTFDFHILPRDSLVLVTGANSFLGMHIASQLLSRGYRVRGTVRDAEKAISTAKFFLDRFGAGRYMTAVIPDMAASGAFDLAIRSCVGVVHVASVTVRSADPNEVITPSIAGAVNVLEAAAKEAGVRRVVLTSCVSAAVGRDRPMTAGTGSRRSSRQVVGGESWNMEAFTEAWGPPAYLEEGWSVSGRGSGVEEARIAAIAASSKMQTEQAAWRWFWERRPAGFELNTVLPATLWGSPLYLPQTHSTPASIALLGTLLSSTTHPPSSSAAEPSDGSGHFTNPTDAATLHLAALLLPDVQHERIFAVGGPWTRAALAELSGDVCEGGDVGCGEGSSGGGVLGEASVLFSGVHRAESLLKRMGRPGWRNLESSLREAVEGFGLSAGR